MKLLLNSLQENTFSNLIINAKNQALLFMTLYIIKKSGIKTLTFAWLRIASHLDLSSASDMGCTLSSRAYKTYKDIKKLKINFKTKNLNL